MQPSTKERIHTQVIILDSSRRATEKTKNPKMFSGGAFLAGSHSINEIKAPLVVAARPVVLLRRPEIAARKDLVTPRIALEASISHKVATVKALLAKTTPFNPALFNPYRLKFQTAMNFKPTSSVASKITLAPSQEDLEHAAEFRFCVYLTVPHLGNDGVGLNQRYVLKKIIELLEKMPTPHPELIAQLKFAVAIEGLCENGEDALKIVSKIKSRIATLSIGQGVAIVSGTRNHAMLLQITRQKVPRFFRLVNHNSGDGNEFHTAKIDEVGRQVCLRGFELEHVLVEKLVDKRASFLDELIGLRELEDTSVFYKQILPKLGGSRVVAKKDPRSWHHSQLGDSCTVGASMSLLSSHMTEVHHSEFMDIARYESLLKIYCSIKKEVGNIQSQKIAALELIGKLERRYKKHATLFPDELLQIKNELNTDRTRKFYQPIDPKLLAKVSEALPKLQASSCGNVATPAAAISVTESIAQSFDILLKEGFDPQAIPAIMTYLQQAFKVEQIDEPEYHKLIAFGIHIGEFAMLPLTKDQFYTVAGIVSWTANIIENLQNNLDAIACENLKSDEEFNKNYQTFFTVLDNLHEQFNAMQPHVAPTQGHYQIEIDEVIRKYQAKFLAKLTFLNEAKTPSNLA